MRSRYASCLVAMLCMSFAASCVQAAACDDPPRLRFSLVPQGDTKKDAAAFQPMLEALERELGKPVEVIYPDSYDFVVEGLLATRIDLAFLGPASYVSAKNSDPDIEAFASYSTRAGAFQQEGSFYRSLLVVRSTSRYRDSESLKGAKLALVDPVSTSGAVVPRRLFSPLIKATFESYFSRVVYSGGHNKSAAALANRQIDAAFIASNHLSDFVAAGNAAREDYRVLWQSEPIPLDPFVYRGRLCAPIKDGIRKVFLANNGERYPELLARYNAVRLSPVSDDSYSQIRELLRTTQ